MKGRSRRYNDVELDWLEKNHTLVIGEYHRAFVAAFGRADISAANLHSLRKRRGWTTGRTGRFEKGSVPANKDKRCPDGTGGRHPNARRTQFKKGHEPHNTNYVGHERVSKDGYVEISVAERNPHTGYGRRYVLKHRWLWEQANGPVPDDHALKCRDGDRTNCDPANWMAVPRALLPQLAGRHTIAYDTAEPEIRPVLLTLAKVKHAAGQIKKDAR